MMVYIDFGVNFSLYGHGRKNEKQLSPRIRVLNEVRYNVSRVSPLAYYRAFRAFCDSFTMNIYTLRSRYGHVFVIALLLTVTRW